MNEPTLPPGEQMFSARAGLGAGPMLRFLIADRHVQLSAPPVDRARRFGRDAT